MRFRVQSLTQILILILESGPLFTSANDSNDVPEDCGPNEEYTECGNYCKEEIQFVQKKKSCPEVCETGCFCITGYFRDGFSNCNRVPEEFLQNLLPGQTATESAVTRRKCLRQNEELVDCGDRCRESLANAKNRSMCQPLQCLRGCFCGKGFLRDDRGICVQSDTDDDDDEEAEDVENPTEDHMQLYDESHNSDEPKHSGPASVNRPKEEPDSSDSDVEDVGSYSRNRPINGQYESKSYIISPEAPEAPEAPEEPEELDDSSSNLRGRPEWVPPGGRGDDDHNHEPHAEHVMSDDTMHSHQHLIEYDDQEPEDMPSDAIVGSFHGGSNGDHDHEPHPEDVLMDDTIQSQDLPTDGTSGDSCHLPGQRLNSRSKSGLHVGIGGGIRLHHKRGNARRVRPFRNRLKGLFRKNIRVPLGGGIRGGGRTGIRIGVRGGVGGLRGLFRKRIGIGLGGGVRGGKRIRIGVAEPGISTNKKVVRIGLNGSPDRVSDNRAITQLIGLYRKLLARLEDCDCCCCHCDSNCDQPEEPEEPEEEPDKEEEEEPEEPINEETPDVEDVLGEEKQREPECAANERYSDCGTDCGNKCADRMGLTMGEVCTRECRTGCFCAEGFCRDEDNHCVPLSSTLCPDGEMWTECGDRCLESIDSLVATALCDARGCQSGCFCKEGQKRNESGICVVPKVVVPTEDCPPPPECPMDEEFLECGNRCLEKMDNIFSEDLCYDMRCDVGCFCRRGLYRNRIGECVPPDRSVCPPNEAYTECGNRCMESPVSSSGGRRRLMYGLDCDPSQCDVGCFCVEHFYRDADGRCVLQLEEDYEVEPTEEEIEETTSEWPIEVEEDDYQEPTTEEPTTPEEDIEPEEDKKSNLRPSTTEEPTTEEPTTEEPTTEEPTTEEPTTEEPTTEMTTESTTEEVDQEDWAAVERTKAPKTKAPKTKAPRTKAPRTTTTKVPKTRCGPNEEYKKCGHVCDEEVGPMFMGTNELMKACDRSVCEKGCFCVQGYQRNDDKKCVPKQAMPVLATGPLPKPKKPIGRSGCKDNESFTLCVNSCAQSCVTYLEKSADKCGKSCKLGCGCNSGYYRTSQGFCVLAKDCNIE